MSGFFSFDFIHSQQSDGRKQRWAVMFISREHLDIDSFCQHFVTHLESHPPPDFVYVLAHQNNREFLATLASKPRFLDRLPSMLRGTTPFQSVVFRSRLQVNSFKSYLEAFEPNPKTLVNKYSSLA